jgi:hypothetical protein
MVLMRNRNPNRNLAKVGHGTGTVTFLKSQPDPEPELQHWLQERLIPADGRPASAAREQLAVPREEPSIAGLLDVALGLQMGWKRRFITVVNDGLYIWTTHK